jgi:hypothetical protein
MSRNMKIHEVLQKHFLVKKIFYEIKDELFQLPAHNLASVSSTLFSKLALLASILLAQTTTVLVELRPIKRCKKIDEIGIIVNIS